MSKSSPDKPYHTIETRKQGHVELCVQRDVSFHSRRTGFSDLHFKHNALPELDFAEVDTATSWLGKPLSAPLIISSMTGGYPDAEQINHDLARGAQQYGLAMGVGSARQALQNAEQHRSFSIVRRVAPSIPIFTNIGGHEVARMHAEDKIGELRRIIDLIEADAIAIHLNPLQELMQPEGSTDFRGVLSGIEEVVRSLGVPVIVKEVGAGISAEVAKKLLDVGVSVIDVAGAGGTSWAGVEILRHDETEQASLEPFWDWGIPTVQAVLDVASLHYGHDFTLIASGGITTGVDIAKSIALGANLAAMARPLIKSLIDGGPKALHKHIESTLFQLRGAMFLTGSLTLQDLAKQDLFAN
jgi:isopentenyl-diphosphate Delta-isomerase